MNNIHSTALVDKQAQLGAGNIIGPQVVIESDVVLGDNNQLMTGAVLKQGCRIGNENCFHEYATLAGLPQDVSFDAKARTLVEVGDHNIFREYATVNRATLKEQGITQIGSHNYFMVHAHIGHDCVIGNHITFVTSCGLGGHVQVEDRAFISGGVMVHQFVRIGQFAMIGGNAKITQDVLPFMITDGNPAQVKGLNLVGLKRGGFKHSQIQQLKQAYRIIFSDNINLNSHIQTLRDKNTSVTNHLADFIIASKRGFHRQGQT